jgi:XTP/dITP diphosphohydrolase
MYPYNGVATKDGHEWTFEANKLDIDEFMTEMEGYVGYVSGAKVKGAKRTAYNDGEYYTATGETEGEILRARDGVNGFGYDPIFYSYDLKKSMGIATDEEKNSVSHRSRALKEIVKFIK